MSPVQSEKFRNHGMLFSSRIVGSKNGARL